MNKPSSDLLCPSCHGALHPRVLECRDCDIRIEGDFEGSEFDRLTGEELHLLRIFIRCEGRIREMESALGVSYPTVKSRLAGLRDRLGLSEQGVSQPTVKARLADVQDRPGPSVPREPRTTDPPAPGKPAGETVEKKAAEPPGSVDLDTLLDDVEQGTLDGDEAIRRLRE